MKRCFIIFGTLACASTVALGVPPKIRSGRDLLAAMHARYPSWYRTVTFAEEADTRNPDGTIKHETWYEALALPGRLRINIGRASDGNGLIIANGELSRFKNSTLTAKQPFLHLLLILGFDVYRQSPETTIRQVEGQGFDLTKIHDDVWDGQSVFVVGANNGDLKSKQFWVEKRRLLFVRLIEPAGNDASKLNDTRFSDYRRLSSGWIAAGVEFYVNGRETFSEQYSAMKPNVKLDPALFDPAQFGSRGATADEPR